MAALPSLLGSIASAARLDGYAAVIEGLPGGPPLAHWRLGEAGGPQIRDRKGARHGTYSGTIGYGASGLPQNSGNGAIDFAGTGQGTVPHDAGLALPAFSLSFWFRTPNLPSETTVWHILSKEQSGFAEGDFFVRIDSGGGLTINFQSSNTNHAINSIVAPETTYHLCVRVDNTGFDTYLNAQNLGKIVAFTGAWSTNTNDLQFGIAPFSAVPANVVLDEVALYARVITDAEVQALAQREQAPTAAADVSAVPESATTVIDVTANDTFVGSKAGLTITIVSQPGGGDSVAVTPSNDIAYTAGAVAADTDRSFQYRITDANGTSNTATVSVTVLDAGTPVATNANCYVESGEDTVMVNANPLGPALAAALAAAPPGRNILIAPGTYTGGTATFDSSGTAANPIVIRPQNGIGMVTINGAQWTIANTSSRLVVSKLFFNNSRIILNGDHNRITRCRWRQLSSAAVNFLTARDCRVDHCDFSDYVQNTNKKRVITWDPDGFDNGTNVRNLLDYCYFHDLVYTATNLGNGNEPLSWFAQAQNMSLGPAGAVGTIDHCLFSNQAVLGESEFISLKSGGWKVSFCTFDNIDFYSSFRTGDNGEIRSCWFEGTKSPAFNIFGSNHLFIGNRFAGGLNGRIAPGVATSAQVAAGTVGIGAYARSDSCQIIGNRMGSGRLQIGAYWSVSNPESAPTLPALNNNLFENTRDSGGDAHSFDAGTLADGDPRHSGTTFNDPGADSQFDYLPAVKIPVPTGNPATDQVGLAAPDPLCQGGPQS